MSVLKKSSKGSSRQQIQIQGVRDGILILPKNEYRLVLNVSSLNFELKSETEQDAIIDTYQSFLNSMNSDFQIMVRIREMDVDRYLENFNARVSGEKVKVYKGQALNYANFVKSLIDTNKILTRQFYVVLTHKGNEDFSLVTEQLRLQQDIVSKGLSRLGMHTRQLNSIEILDLFYSFYSPAQAKRQPLREQTLQMVSEVYA